MSKMAISWQKEEYDSNGSKPDIGYDIYSKGHFDRKRDTHIQKTEARSLIVDPNHVESLRILVSLVPHGHALMLLTKASTDCSLDDVALVVSDQRLEQ